MNTNAQALLKEKLRAKNVFRYILLPGFIPQIKELIGSGFGYFAFLIATVYNAVRILPKEHPYLNPSNIGKFGLRDVVAAAANNVSVSRKNWDQIVIFIAIIAGIVLLAIQFAAFIWMIFMGQAFAQSGPAPFTGMFDTPFKETDIAFQLLDHTFGIPDFFGSNVPTATPFHSALHELFHFYNVAILIVAVLIFIYYIIVVVGETAQSGTPFGKRFAHIYAPIRLVVAIGLLVPLAHGFNGAQYITLYAAKIGSGFATNGWLLFNRNLENPTGENTAALIGEPEAPDPTSLISFMSVAKACGEAYKIKENKTIDSYVYNGTGYVISARNTFDAARTASVDGTIEVIFGEFIRETGGAERVQAYCGSVIVPANMSDEAIEAGTENLQEDNYAIVNFLWNSELLEFIGKRIARNYNFSVTSSGYVDINQYICEEVPDPYADTPETERTSSTPTGDNCEISHLPPSNYKESMISTIRSIVQADLSTYITEARRSVDYTLTDDIKQRGWGGAGIWYSKISEINGAYTVAALSFPEGREFPEIMQHVLDEKRRLQSSTATCKMFEPNVPSEKGQIEFERQGTDSYYASVMDEAFQYWRCENYSKTTNIFWDSIGAVFGLNGLFSVRDVATLTTTNPDGTPGELKVSIHPLAQLTVIGKSLVESAIRNMGFAMFGAFGGGMTEILPQGLAPALQAGSGFFVSIATVGLSIGFILFYILPFLPFIYFFFAVGAWVKSIFEAMCAAPLWAIAHLRIDGEGLPGKSATNGYFLILEIFLRPILTVFGLVAGMASFVALATILNEVFDLVVVNVTGNPLSAPGAETEEWGRHIVDQFFFTIVYAVILYMMATASFKMINLVPNNILRWLGSSATAFSDNTQDPTQGLSQYTAIGTNQLGGKLMGGFTQLGQGTGAGVAGAINLGRGPSGGPQ
ncbi:MAG: DotA/TraY family protein [Pseudomonadota bacterium]